MESVSNVSSTFLSQLVGGGVFQTENAHLYVIESPSVLKALFTQIVGVVDEAQQDATLDALISLVKPNCANVEACTRVGFHMDILAFLRDKALYRDGFISNNVLKKTLRLLMYICNHSVTISDVRAMLQVFQSPRMVHDPPDDNSMSLYLSTLEVIARDAMGPCAFFDLNGQHSGLLLPTLESFPHQGYTFCVWIKFERLPKERAPLFTLCGSTGAGVMAWFQNASLFLMSTDKKRSEMQIEIQDLMVEGKWQFLSIAHTHRQLRSSKVDVYVNAELMQSVKLSYPNTASVSPLLRPLLCLGEVDDQGKPCRSLRALCGPMALFGQALPSTVIQTLRTTDDYDALILQFNAFISSASLSGNSGSSELSKNVAVPTGAQDGLIFSYDARNCDRVRGLCFDSSGNGRHAEASSAGVRLRNVDKLKRVIAELGGPLICLPLLVTTSPGHTAESQSNSQDQVELSKTLEALRTSTIQFAEDKEFLQHIGGLIARPLGVRSIPRVIALLAEIMRHSPINKFCFRRHQGVRVTALLLRTLPAQYLSTELFTSVERLRNAVLSDRTLSEDIYKSLLFNFRIWVNGSMELQDTVFDKLELMTRKDTNISSASSTRHFLRCLSWIYWQEPNPTVLSRCRVYSTPEIAHLRKRLLDILKIVMCETQQPKSSSVISLSSKSKEAKPQLSYESTRALVFCMIGKPSSQSAIHGASQDSSSSDTSSSNNSSGTSSSKPTVSDGDDHESIVESVAEADLPDLLQLLIELSVQESAPTGLLELFRRLGGLRIWLPLLSFSSNVIRVMTLRLLRRYLFLQCNCSNSRERTTSSMENSVTLSVSDAHLIMQAVNATVLPPSVDVYSEVLLLMLGIDVTECDASIQPASGEFDYWIDERLLSQATIWHLNLLLPILQMVSSSSLAVRLLAARHFGILFGSNTPQSAQNRSLLFMSDLVADDYAPFIESLIQMRGPAETNVVDTTTAPTFFGFQLALLANLDVTQLRQMAFGADQTEETRFNAMYSLVKCNDVDFLLEVLADGTSPVTERKRVVIKVWQQPYMSGQVKLVLAQLLAQCQPQATGKFVTASVYDILINMTCLEVTSNEAAWYLVRGPFGALSARCTKAQDLEMLVMDFVKRLLIKLNDIVADQFAAAATSGKTPGSMQDLSVITRSALWRNVESICTIVSSIVLHYHPDSVGEEDSTTQTFWKCKRRLVGETEVVDLLLRVWQHLVPFFSSEQHGSFGRTTKAQRYDVDSVSSRTQSLRSSIDEARDRLSSGSLISGPASSRAASFPGLKILSSSSGGATSSGVSQMRPHPGGPMRQTLQLFLRSFHLILLETQSLDPTSITSSANDCQNRFLAMLTRLEYFLQVMKLGCRDASQFESSFVPLNDDAAAAGGEAGCARLIKSSTKIKAAPGNESSIVLWFVPELADLTNQVRFMHWADSAFKLAAILSSLITIPIRSFEELEKFLEDTDFTSNNQEVRRRDTFFHEQIVHSKDRRTTRRMSSADLEKEEKQRAQVEIDRICQSTRASSDKAQPDSKVTEQVWLQRIRAKDVDDWIRLRLLLKWGVRHLWQTTHTTGDDYGQKDDYWRLDSYTSSNWIRCRMVPDTDDTKSDDLRSNATPATMERSENVANSLSLPFSITSPVQQEEMMDQLADPEEDQERFDSFNDPNGTLQSDLMIGEQIELGDFPLQGFQLDEEESGEKQQQEVNYMEVELSNQQTNTNQTDEPSSTSGNADEDLSFTMKTTSDKSLGRSRLGNISSRFSTGLLRLRKGKSQSMEINDDQSASSAPAPSPNPNDMKEPLKPSTPGAPAAPTNTSSSSHSMSRVLRKPEPWKSFSGTYRTKAYLVLPSGVIVYGSLRIGTSTIIFEGEQVTTLQAIADGKDSSNFAESQVSQLRRRAWGIRVIRVIHRRRFLLNIWNGIEVYFVDGSSCLFGLEKPNEADVVYAFLRERKPPCLAKWGKRLLTTERLFTRNKWTEMWVRREISNFEYLMLLNISAGRSYNDITQYPVFPWILRDYESDHIDLSDTKFFRDFRKPIGAQTPETISKAQEIFESFETESSNSNPKTLPPAVPPHHFAIPYSNMNAVLYFLLRLAPFTTAAFEMNGISSSDPTQEPADAWFDSIQDAFVRCTSESDKFYELTPEFFCCPDFLVGKSNQFFSRDLNQVCFRPPQKKVALPNWASSPHDFIRKHRLALESDYVSANLNHWIDLVFGFRQRGPLAIEAKNVFHAACYPDQLDLNSMKTSIRAKLTQRGVIPVQLFQKAHPSRMTQDEAMAARFPSSNEVALLSSRRQIRRHDLNSRHKDSIINIRFSNAFSNSGLGIGGPALGSGSGIGAHASSDRTSVVYTSDKMGVVLAKKFINHTPDHSRNSPLSLIDIEQWWKLPEGCLVSDGVVFYEQMISCGYWDGSWRIHWSADGELIQRIAFHKKKILCMACSEDDFTGDLALAFGSEDCTISVWALSKLAASRSRRMFVKKELPVGNLPWVLLFGHTNPVVSVALHVDMDVVVSCSTQNSVMIHSLRSAIPLHTIDIDCQINSVITQLCISQHGDILIHAIAEEEEEAPSQPPNQDGGLLDFGFPSSSPEPIRTTITRSDLYRASMNGDLIGYCRLQDDNGSPLLLLKSGALFTRSGEYILTARAGLESAIEVRDVGNMDFVVRRIDCKRPAELTSFGVSQDERCVICGYEDGAVVAYALHFGVCDLGATQQQLDKRAREEEAEALARANKRDILMKETANNHTKRIETQLFKRSHCFVLLKRPCVSDDPLYEEAREELWYAVYGPKKKKSSVATENLIDFGFGPDTPKQSNEKEFERAGETWSRLGFQRPDPTTDFRAGGMLSLQCLLYFAKHMKRELVRMVNTQIPGSRENTYPWGPAGINITCMTASLFWKSDGELCSERSLNWSLFVNHEAFYKVFCDAFLLFDRLWTELNAQYGTFSVVIQETKKRVVEVLDMCQGDLALFRSEMRCRFLEKPVERRELKTPPLTPSGARNREGSMDFISSHEVIDLLTSFAPKTPPLSISVSNSVSTTAAAASDLTAAAVDRATQLYDFITFSPARASMTGPVQPQVVGASGTTTTATVTSAAPTTSTTTSLNDFQLPPTSSAMNVDPFANNDFVLRQPPTASTAATMTAPIQSNGCPAKGNPLGASMQPFPQQQQQQQQQQQTKSEDPFACLLDM